MKKVKNKILALLLAFILLAGSIPCSDAKVHAASKTYDITYQNGAFIENGQTTTKGIDDYFSVKKIASVTEEVEGVQTITGASVSTYEESDKYQLTGTNIILKKAEWDSYGAAQTAYMLDFKASAQYGEQYRDIAGYDVTTASNWSWCGRPDGMFLPFYYDEASQGYYGFVFNSQASCNLQGTLAYVGTCRQYYGNNYFVVANFLNANAAGSDLSYVKLGISYAYEGDVIATVTVSLTPYYADGTSGTTSIFEKSANDLITRFEQTTGNTDSGGLSIQVPTQFQKSGVVAGVISGNSDAKSTIAGINISLSRTAEEIAEEEKAEVEAKLPVLYEAFVNDKSLAQADKYLEVYNSLSDDLKSSCASQVQDILSWLKLQLVSGKQFTLNKTEFEAYPNVLEYVWPNESTSGSAYTRANADIYDMTGVVSTTAVYHKSKLVNGAGMYLLSDLADASDTYTTNHNEFGYAFWNYTVTYSDADGASQQATWPLIDANYSNLSAGDTTGVLYKSANPYGKDQWGTDFQNVTQTNDTYLAYAATDYLAVEYRYITEEQADATVPHTAYRLYVKMWADDGDGVCEDTETVLIEKDRTTDQWYYVAIHYLNGEPRVRKAAMTDTAFDALHSLVLVNEKEEEVDWTAQLPALYEAFMADKSYANAEGYLKAYNQLSDEEKSDVAEQFENVSSWIKVQLVNGSSFVMNKTELEAYPNVLEYVWPNESTSGSAYTRANADIYDMTGVVSTTAVYHKSKLVNGAGMYLLSDLADASDTYTTNHNEFGYAFSNYSVTYSDADGASQQATWPLIDANYSNLSADNTTGVLYKSANQYGKDQWGTDFKNVTQTNDTYLAYAATDYLAVEYRYITEEQADAEVPHTAYRLYVKMWADDGDGVCEDTETVLIEKDRTTDQWYYVAIHYSNGKPRVRKAAMTDTAFDALHSIKLTHELSQEEEAFSDTYAEVLKRSPEVVEPYDLAEVTEMLQAVESTFGSAEQIADATLRSTVIELQKVHDAWDLTSAQTKADSFRKIHFADGKLQTTARNAWNVYNRLTADVKALLQTEYEVLKASLGNEDSAQTETMVACIGDSLTWGAGSINNDDNQGEAYPTYLQTQLGTEYVVNNYGVMGMRVVDQSVYDTANQAADMILDYSDHNLFATSLSSGAEIVILQLGVNDASYIYDMENRECGLELYRRGLEELMQTYLRLEHSPFLVISNTARSYNTYGSDPVYREVAKINMELAAKYGFPCVDMYAKTNAYGEDYTTYYHTDNLHMNRDGYQDMASVFCNVIQSLDKVVETTDTYGYEWTENEVNRFLAPELYSATIKNTPVPSEQGLGFKTFLSSAQKTGTNITGYGTIFARYNTALSLKDMTLDNVGKGTYFRAHLAVSGDGSELHGSSYIAGINCHNNDEFKKVYIARSYVVYEDGTVYYSMNTRDDLESSYGTRTGVLNGYATRAVTGVAKSMVKALAEQETDVSTVAEYDAAEKTLTWQPGVTGDDAKQIFEFICSHYGTYHTVYVSATGDDEQDGQASAPVKSLAAALAKVSDGGTISVVDTVTVPSTFQWKERGKSITITGGTLDFTSLSDVVLGDHVTFDNITLTLYERSDLLANGYRLKICDKVTMTNPIHVYGGGLAGTTVASTDVTLLSGNYYKVFGGSQGGTVTGEVKLKIGGTVNEACDADSHAGTYNVYGGGDDDSTCGDTNVVFTGSAKANYLYGGSYGTGKVGTTNVTFLGGQIMSLYGGNNESPVITGVNVVVSGGEMQQLFGGNEGATLNGDVNVTLSAGKITRRVYGGCYNDFNTEQSLLGSWASQYYVNGTITLTIASGMSITFDEVNPNPAWYETDNLYSDRSVYARSRQGTVSNQEQSVLVMADAQAYETWITGNKLGARDTTMQGIMNGITAYGTLQKSYE